MDSVKGGVNNARKACDNIFSSCPLFMIMHAYKTAEIEYTWHQKGYDLDRFLHGLEGGTRVHFCI